MLMIVVSVVACWGILLGPESQQLVWAQETGEGDPKTGPQRGSSLDEIVIPKGRTPISGIELFLTESGYTVVLPAMLVRDRTYQIEFEKRLAGFSLVDLKQVFEKNGFNFYYDERIEHRPLPKKKTAGTHDSWTSGKITLSTLRRFVVKRGWIFISPKSEDETRTVRLTTIEKVTDKDIRGVLRRCGYLAKYKKPPKKKYLRLQ